MNDFLVLKSDFVFNIFCSVSICEHVFVEQVSNGIKAENKIFVELGFFIDLRRRTVTNEFSIIV